MSHDPRRRPVNHAAAARGQHQLLPAVVILASGVLAAALILIAAADSVPLPTYSTPGASSTGPFGPATRTPDDPAGAHPWTLDGR